MQTTRFKKLSLFVPIFVWLALFFPPHSALAGVAYQNPPGGWSYLYDGVGDAAGAGGAVYDALDGTWTHGTGNSAWDGSQIGGGLPGGAMTVTAGDGTTFLRIQDTGDPRQHGFTAGDPSNRKVGFHHNLTAEGVSPTILDDGVTITFRARLATTATGPLDPMVYPADGSAPFAWPALGNGTYIHDNAKDNFHIRQIGNGEAIAFSLANSGANAEYAAGGGLAMNHLNGTTQTGDVDAGEAGTPNILPIGDESLTEWHEFWITIVGDTSGGGTHRVEIYMDGSLTPSVFHVTAGTHDENSTLGDLTLMAFGAGATPQYSAFDTDFYGYKPGIYTPEPATAGKIAWVTFHPADDTPSANAAAAGFTEAPDAGYTRFLEDNGYTVTRIITSVTPDAGLLNTFDLVIIGRSTSSTHYQNAGATAWNGITAPMIVMNGYTTRNSRMGYTTGATVPDTAGDVSLTVNVPTHPIFAGIALNGNKTMRNAFAGLADFNGTTERGISVNTDPVAGGGTVLATVGTAGDPAQGGMMIGEWQAGAVMADGTADVLAGHRLVFFSGSREHDGLTSEGAGIYDLTDDGAKMFLQAVQYMSGTLPPPLIANVVQTGGVTPQAEWTGQTFDHPNLGAGFTVPYFNENVPAYTDRTHEYSVADVLVGIPSYLNGLEYIMMANNSREDAAFQLNIALNDNAILYLLFDNRMPLPAWVTDDGFTPVSTGANRAGSLAAPDEVGIDESADGTINNWFDVYSRVAPAGVAITHERGGTGNNMYGLVVGPVPKETNTIVLQPQSQTIEQGHPVSFSVEVEGPPHTSQWYYNEAPIQDAIQDTYAIPQAQFADAGDYSVVVTAQSGGVVTSDTATLTVNPDTTLPTVVSVSGDPTLRQIVVTFSEAINPDDAKDAFNFFNTSFTVYTAVQLDPQTVLLGTDPQTPNTTYTLEIFNVRDISDNQNQIADPTAIDFTSWVWSPGFMAREFYYDLSGTNGFSTLTNSPKWPSHPDLTDYFPQYAVNPALGDSGRDNYGVKVFGFIIPSESGLYQFQLHSDDSGWLLLNPTDDDPATKETVILVEGDCGGCTQPIGPLTYNLTAGQMYYTEALMQEGTGGDYLVISWATPSNPGVFVPIPRSNLAAASDPANVATITIEQQPQAAAIEEFRAASFTVVANNDQGVTQGYQWRKNGINIPNANNDTYTIASVQQADDGAMIDVVVSVPGASVISDSAMLTVTLDVTPPEVLSTAAASSTQIGVEFSEALNVASATDPSHWTVSDACGSKTIDSIALYSPSKVMLTLNPATPVADGYELVVNGVTDAGGNPVSVTLNGVVWASFEAGIGGSSPLGGHFSSQEGVVQVQADGTDIFGTSDQFNYLYNLRAADFDVKVKVNRLDATDGAAKAGIMARVSLDAASPNTIAMMFPVDAPGRNTYNVQFRDTQGGSSYSLTSPPTGIDPQTPPNVDQYPAWLRLKRTGTVFEYLYSQDGTTWASIASEDSINRPWLGGPVLLGLAVNSHLAGSLTTADFEDYGDFTTYPDADLTLSGLADKTIAENKTATFSVTATVTGAPEGLLEYRWYLESAPNSGCFELLAGEYENTVAIPMLSLAQNGIKIKSVALVPGKRTEAVATISVIEDTVPPTLVAACGDIGLTQVRVQFSEPINESLAIDAFNYFIAGLNIVGDAVVASPDTVVLTTTPQTPGATYTLEVYNIEDLVGNPIAPDAAIEFPVSAITFTEQPQSIEVTAFNAANFRVAAFNTDCFGNTATLSYQWQRDDGAGFMDIPGATDATYNLLVDQCEGSPAFRVIVSTPAAVSATSDVAVLAIQPDTVPPRVVIAARQIGNPAQIILTFDRKLNPASATDTLNYQVNNNTVVTGVNIDSASQVVTLTVDPALEDFPCRNYLVTVDGVFNGCLGAATESAVADVFLGLSLGQSGTLIANVVETGGYNEATDTIVAQWTGQTFVNGVANEPVKATAADAPYTVGYMGHKAPAFVDREHAWFSSTPALPIPPYLVNQEYLMIGNDNRDRDSFQLDITVNAPAVAYLLFDERMALPAWVADNGWVPVKTGQNRAGDFSQPDELGLDEGANNDINSYFAVYAKAVPAGSFSMYERGGSGNNMYGVVIGNNPRPQLIANVAESGGQNEATDTIVAQWTGQTFVTGVADEPIKGTSADASYTVGYFGFKAPAYVDRSHAYFAPDGAIPIPEYLVNQEYIMSGNDNKQAGYRLDVTVNAPAKVYFLWDQRNNPPPAWLASEGFAPMRTGANRSWGQHHSRRSRH